MWLDTLKSQFSQQTEDTFKIQTKYHEYTNAENTEIKPEQTCLHFSSWDIITITMSSGNKPFVANVA